MKHKVYYTIIEHRYLNRLLKLKDKEYRAVVKDNKMFVRNIKKEVHYIKLCVYGYEGIRWRKSIMHNLKRKYNLKKIIS